MRDYGKVHTSFWTSPNIRAMSEDGRALALYLLTCQHGTIAGVFRLPNGYICEDLQWEAERVETTLAELFHNGFATRCEFTKWVYVCKHMDWNPPENPNQIKSAAKVANQIPDGCCWKAAFIGRFGSYLGLVVPTSAPKQEPLPNPSETVSQPITETVTVTTTVAVTETEKKTKAAAQAPFVLPDWIPQDAWSAFMEVRKAKKAKNTDYALELILKTMEQIRAAGGDAIEAMNNSIKSGWSDVYAPKGQQKHIPKAPGKHTGFNEMNYREGIAEDGTIA